MNIFNIIRIFVASSIVGIIIYKTLLQNEKQDSSLMNVARPFKTDKAKTDSTGPLGTFGMS